MTIKRFGEGSDLDDEALILFENFGITVYLAQLYEGFLSNILTGLERLGAIEIPKEARRDNIGYVDENLGSMLRILLDQSQVDRATIRLLRKAHFQRNLLVHRFMLENIHDTLNSAGRRSVNDKLASLRTNIGKAMHIAMQISIAVWKELGIDPDEANKRIQEMRRLAKQSNIEGLTEE
jgi:hypothetical protein